MWFGVAPRDQKDMCSKEIGLSDQNMIMILGSKITIFGGPKRPFNGHKNLHSDNEWDIDMDSKNYEELTTASLFIANHLVLIGCFLS
jgi:hypothetical protein